MGTDLLLFHRFRILSLMESVEGQAFLEWLRGWRDSDSQRLRKERDETDLHRLQGELVVLERILDLENELKSYNRRKLQAEVDANQRGQK